MLRRIAAEQPPVDEVNESLRRYVEALIEPSDPQRNAATAQTRHLNAQLVADLINAATPAQRSALAKRLRGYADDFTVLASEGGRG
jgi:hypothetical protein